MNPLFLPHTMFSGLSNKYRDMPIVWNMQAIETDKIHTTDRLQQTNQQHKLRTNGKYRERSEGLKGGFRLGQSNPKSSTELTFL